MLSSPHLISLSSTPTVSYWGMSGFQNLFWRTRWEKACRSCDEKRGAGIHCTNLFYFCITGLLHYLTFAVSIICPVWENCKWIVPRWGRTTVTQLNLDLRLLSDSLWSTGRPVLKRQYHCDLTPHSLSSFLFSSLYFTLPLQSITLQGSNKNVFI